MSQALKIALGPLLVAQGLWTRRRTLRLPEAAGPREGVAGEGEPLRLLIVGDSSAAGVGVEHQRQALAGHLPQRLGELLGRQVQWQLVARSGVTSAQALQLVKSWEPAPAEIALVILGVNDVVDRVPVARAIEAREALADWLFENVSVRHVAFAALPPMDRFPALPRPLRNVIGADARRHDHALAAWAAACIDVSHVPLALSLEAAHMAVDGFHPGATGYRACGEALAEQLALIVATFDTTRRP